MSAKRYSGDVTITLTYRNISTNVAPNGDYRATLSWQSSPGSKWARKHRHTVYVGAPAHLRHGVDSPEAYDETAHAALSFASEEEPEIGEHAAMNESGWTISRSPHLRWGGPLHEQTLRRRTRATRRKF